MKVKEKALNGYIAEKHSQDECSGFIDGWESAEKRVKTESLERLRQQYGYATKDYQTEYVKNKVVEHYNAMRLFCIDCSLLTFSEIELMEYEVDSSVI